VRVGEMNWKTSEGGESERKTTVLNKNHLTINKVIKTE
jgi:hypothetical protein